MVSGMSTRTLIRVKLLEQYGRPTRVDAAEALRLAGKSDELAAEDVFAFRYCSREAAEAWRQANLEHWGHPSLALIPDGDGWIGIYDLRPAIAAAWVGP